MKPPVTIDFAVLATAAVTAGASRRASDGLKRIIVGLAPKLRGNFAFLVG
jgi:hypothetical protein